VESPGGRSPVVRPGEDALPMEVETTATMLQIEGEMRGGCARLARCRPGGDLAERREGARALA